MPRHQKVGLNIYSFPVFFDWPEKKNHTTYSSSFRLSNMFSKWGLKDKAKVGVSAARSLARGTVASRRGIETDDLSICHGKRSDPIEIRNRDPTHCFYGMSGANVSPRSFDPLVSGTLGNLVVISVIGLLSGIAGASMLTSQVRQVSQGDRRSLTVIIIGLILLAVAGFMAFPWMRSFNKWRSSA